MNTFTGFARGFLFSRVFIFTSLALSFWLGLGSIPLFDLDEGAFTEATREMLESGVYSATYLDGEPRYDKPIFFYWIQALSIKSLGYHEWAFRLPSVLAACLWAFAVFQFTKEFLNTQRAHIATLFLINSLWVALIARSAIADALLNLFLSLTLFDIWRYLTYQKQRHALRLYMWMALGTLTKGPIAVVVPLSVSFLYLLSQKQLRQHYMTYFYFKGWAIYFAIVTPWIIAVSLEQGSGFFQGFIVEHNLKRFSSTRENHGGSVFYYIFILPLILLPLSGLLLETGKKAKKLWSQNLQRYLLIWCLVIIAIFSFSKTQLPHYILNACVPIILLFCTAHTLNKRYSWVLIFGFAASLLFLFLPELIAIAAKNSKGYDGALLSQHASSFPENYRLWAILLFVWVCAICTLPKLRTWQRLALIGLALNTFAYTQFAKVASNLQQSQIHEMIAFVEKNNIKETIVAYRMQMPTFSVYRQTITPVRAPVAGEYSLVRVDRYPKLVKAIGNLQHSVVHTADGLMLVKIYSASE